MKHHYLCVLIIISFVSLANSQSVEIEGQIIAPSEVDGIHVINKTASRFTTSNSLGEFAIVAKLNDTLLFSGISYEPKELVVTKIIVASKKMPVYLEEMVNVLDEVVVGKILTGDLRADIENADLQPRLNFYNLGIPGYTGKVKTQSERRLYAATSGGGLIPVSAIINAISGRTKQLKNMVKQEKSDTCLDKIKNEFQTDLFSAIALDEEHRVGFFYYCQDDPGFKSICVKKDAMATLQFLMAKLEDYKIILASEK